jgi:hypothetical protein
MPGNTARPTSKKPGSGIKTTVTVTVKRSTAAGEKDIKPGVSYLKPTLKNSQHKNRPAYNPAWSLWVLGCPF